jgi:hypothetical protein
MTTLTYNPNEAPEGELTAEEQESLALGEQALSAQEELLAGKFRDAEELEQAYIELQKKFSSRDPNEQQQVEEPVAEEQVEEEEGVEPSDNILDTLWVEGLNGEFSEDTINSLQQMNPTDLAKMYLEYRMQAERNTVQTEDITETDLSNLRNIAGGDDSYSDMMRWAGESLSPKEIEMYDAVMDNGDINAMSFAVQALFSRYQDANGIEGELLTGKPASTQKDVFRSQAEVVRAMADPRYDTDPAYRQDVYAKLERSTLDY